MFLKHLFIHYDEFFGKLFAFFIVKKGDYIPVILLAGRFALRFLVSDIKILIDMRGFMIRDFCAR